MENKGQPGELLFVDENKGQPGELLFVGGE
jgi:rRNA maturation protein Rpf1